MRCIHEGGVEDHNSSQHVLRSLGDVVADLVHSRAFANEVMMIIVGTILVNG